MIIFECSIHNFHASFETFSYTRLPNSPRHGTRSSPGKSLSNFTQCTMRSPDAAGLLELFVTASSQCATRILTLLHPLPYSKLVCSILFRSSHSPLYSIS